MRFDAKKPFDIQKAKAKFEYLINNGKVFDLTEKHPKRSIPQNSYLHLILTWFGLELGYTLEEVKQDIFKKIVNHGLFYEGEHGTLVKVERWRSTADLTTAELTTAIDRFRDYAVQNAGIYLPEPDDMALLNDMETQIENQKHLIP